MPATELAGVVLLSSDVFDTALQRAVVRPSAAFLLLGQRLASSGCWSASPGTFAVQRAQAEDSARAGAGGPEPTLRDIYAELAHSPFLVDAAVAMAEELRIERDLLVPLPVHRELLGSARAAGVRVCFVSDTYLPSSFLRERLDGVADPADGVYVSCEHAASKRVGDLFDVVLAAEGAEPGHVLHVGDHPMADGVSATARGLRVRRSEPPEPNRYEALLHRHAVGTSGVSSLLAGAARIVRTAGGTAPPPVVDVAAAVAAPLLVSFVAWSLEQARASGCARVAFVSRDGQILHAIASRLEAARPAHERLPLAYTHGGRRVWHPAGLTARAFEHPPPGWWLGEGMPKGMPTTPSALLALEDEELPEAMVTALAPLARASRAEREASLAGLWHDGDVRSTLLEIGAARRALLCRHLREAGLGSDRWAMVDVGWRGRSAASLNRALEAEGMTTPLHLYLGLIKPDPELTRTGDWASYLFCRPGPDAEAGLLGGGLPSFVEVVCTADHGPVRGFRERDGTVEPVMDPFDPAPEQWGMGAVRDAILAVTERVAPFASELGAVDLTPALKDLVRLFLHAPDPVEVRAWQSFPFGADPSGQDTVPWVARWSTLDALRWAVRGENPHSFWPQASRRLLPWPGRAILAARERAAARVGRRASPRG